MGAAASTSRIVTPLRAGACLRSAPKQPTPILWSHPGKQAIPLGRVNLLGPFGDTSNYHTETLMFEVVDFSELYHVILGWLCYVKFMATPSYAYLKLKIPGPTKVFIVDASMQWALDCEQDNIELTTVAVNATELREFSL
jgi:hypothetical protein